MTTTTTSASHDVAHAAAVAADRARLADDLFDLAAPLLEQPVVARLLPLHSRVPTAAASSVASTSAANTTTTTATTTHGALLLPIDLLLDATAVVLGRGRELSPPYRLDVSTRLSARHCELHVDVLTRRVTLVDTSTNGCYVNGVRVAKRQPVRLHAGDVVALTRPYNSDDDKSNDKNNKKKKMMTGEDDAAHATAADARDVVAGDADVAFVLQRSLPERTLQEAVAEVQCAACHGVLLRPCMLLPCLHTFCASCISRQLRSAGVTDAPSSKDTTNADAHAHAAVTTTMTATIHCTTCGARVTEVRPSHKFDCLVRELTRQHRTYAHDAADVAQRERDDIVPAVGVRLVGRAHAHKRARGSDDDGDSSDGGSSAASSSSTRQRQRRATADEAAAATAASTRRLRHAALDYAHHVNALLTRQLPLHPCRQCRHRRATPAAADNGATLRNSNSNNNNSVDDAYTCEAGASHLVCSACRTLFPQRPLCGRPQRCALCAAPYCGMYYGATTTTTSATKKRRSCDDASAAHNDDSNGSGCVAERASAQRSFVALADHAFAALPAAALGGSVYEQDILRAYMRAHHIDVAALWRVCVDKLHRREWALQQPHVVGAMAVTHSGGSAAAVSLSSSSSRPRQRLSRRSAVCRACATQCFAELLLHYRRTLPRDALPAQVTARPNCWHGVQCPLQFRSAAHAEHYSHACFAQKGKE